MTKRASTTRKVTKKGSASTDAPAPASERPLAPAEPETVIVAPKTEPTTVIVTRASAPATPAESADTATPKGKKEE
jgi:hypothetical protein